MGKKLTLEIIKEYLLTEQSTINIVSKEYINSSTKLECKCSKCSSSWLSTWDNLKQNTNCKFCNGAKLTLDIVKGKLKEINPNIIIISDNFNNANDILTYKCLIDGYEWKTTWGSIKNGNGCKRCSGLELLNLDIIKNRLSINSPNIQLLSTLYINSSSKLKFKCLMCNFEFSSKIQHRGVRCRKCDDLKRTGVGNSNYKGGITPLHNYLRTHILKWKKESFMSSNYKCDISESNKNIVIHHLYNFSEILKETVGELNLPIYQEINKYTELELKLIEDKCLELHYKYGLGICLYKDIHDEFHRIYGKENNTKEQYEEFKLNKLNKKLKEAV